MAALVGAHGDPLDILLDGCLGDLVDRTIVPQVDDLDPLGLQEAPHDIDSGVVAVEQAGGRDEPDRVDR